jgi:hypothetical protein
MALKPEHSLGASLAVMALDFGIYQLHMPVTSDIKASAPHNGAIDSGRKASIWTALSACAALSLLAKDPNIFIFGGGFAIALDWYYRHANATEPSSGQVTLPPAGSNTFGGGGIPGGVSYGG